MKKSEFIFENLGSSFWGDLFYFVPEHCRLPISLPSWESKPNLALEHSIHTVYRINFQYYQLDHILGGENQLLNLLKERWMLKKTEDYKDKK